ncbi:MAG: Na(+)-translocating NADH-quinone reductase subunit A [Candidatus Marinimicrobia bacterium]|nr:Na(+)-translocating NADH-quinone reductase subunit A [Candidatus Neomarinimicrobiota bacterium]
MTKIKIRKGHSIRIAGIPHNELLTNLSTVEVGLCPIEYQYVKPKLLVKEGDNVDIGTPLFFNKENPDQKWGAPGTGTICKIQYGPRRVIEEIVIKLDKDGKGFTNKAIPLNATAKLKREEIKSVLSDSNLWHLIRQRPFNHVANPADEPRDIFISALHTTPLAPNLDLVLNGQKDALQAGINVLKGLTDGDVNIGISSNNQINELTGLDNCKLHQISGPHPAGNVGIQIHHISPLKPDDIVWTVNIQHVIILGKLFLTGEIDPSVIVSIGGPGAKNPCHVKTRIGAKIETLIKDQLEGGEYRIISGDVLTGRTVEKEDYLGFYDTIISILPVDLSRPFLGWLQPGSSNKTYSLSNSFFSFGKKLFKFTTKQNGSKRALVPINAWEDVLPMDIMPNPLYRAILACDVVEMTQLGILECDEEDFALCSFACPSKIDVGAAIRKGLDIMKTEG